MSSSGKRKVMMNTVTVKLGCSSCRKPKLSSIFNPKPKRKTASSPSSSSSSSLYHYYHNKTNKYYYHNNYNSSSMSSWDTAMEEAAATSHYSPPSSSSSEDIKSLRAVQGFGKKIDVQSVAVEKDSQDPYVDFHQSMLQMILEKEIYSKHELKELLNCFLQLNSPYYHGVIVRAFTDIWNGLFSSSSPSLHGGRRSRHH